MVQIDDIIAHEQGTLDVDGTLRLFSDLVKSGDAWILQGCYGRVAMSLIDAGYLSPSGKILRWA